MNIAIGINNYKDFNNLSNREKLCIESLFKCKEKNNISLYNIVTTDKHYPINGLNTLVLPGDKTAEKYIYVNDILDCLESVNSEYIAILNNDIIVNNTLFSQLEEGTDVYPISRGHIKSIQSLEEDVIPTAYSVHGFDMFIFKKSWWSKYKQIFPKMYLGRPYWDTVFFIKSVLNGSYKILNKQPPVIFHIEHDSTSMHEKDHYTTHNENIAKKDPDMQKWWAYVYNVLLKRNSHKGIKWWLPHENELQLEKQYLK
jgi:hypothetical protein